MRAFLPIAPALEASALAALALAALALAPALGTGCGRAAPPNLLLVTVDTLRADALACYGGPPDVGAGLCGLFEGGTRYRWAFAPAPYTAPSIASLLTSRYPGHHGVTQNVNSVLGDEAITVAERLREAGYQTTAFVSNPVLDRGRNLGQGFDVYDQKMTRRERNRPRFLEREAEATTNAALAWARSARREPWFLWVHFQDPHGPYEPPTSPLRPDPPGARRLALLPDHSGRGGIPAYQVLPGTFSREAYEERYRDEIRYLDPHLVRLVTTLDTLGRRPVVVLTSDHGESFGEDDFYFAHGHSVGLDQIRVPLLVRASPSRETAVVDEPVTLLDVAPTLLSLTGLAAPASFLGRALPLDGAPGAARPLFAEHGRQAAIVLGGAVYSRDRDGFAQGGEPGNKMPALPARRARLGSADALPAYEPPGDDPAQRERAAELSAFLDATPEIGGRRRGQVSEEVRERMRALGYVDD